MTTNLESLLQLAGRIDPNGRKYMELADHVRKVVWPNERYPGVLGTISPQAADEVVDVLNKFASRIFHNESSFEHSHIVRGLAALNLCSLALGCRYVRTKEEQDMDDSLRFLETSLLKSAEHRLDGLELCRSATFNFAAFLFKSGVHEFCEKVLSFLIEHGGLGQEDQLNGKCHQLRCQCLLHLGEENSPSFQESLSQSPNVERLLLSCITLRPPSNPNAISQQLWQCKNPLGFAPYFALVGDFDVLGHFEEYRHFFPDLLLPEGICLVEKIEFMRALLECQTLFQSGRLVETSRLAVELLKRFPRDGLRPSDFLALFFVYYWICWSFQGIGKGECSLWYAKEMYKVFQGYGFASGFAIFLELKSRIQIGKLEEIRIPPAMPEHSPCTWELVPSLHQAIARSVDYDADCFHFFRDVFENGNVLVRREAVHYDVQIARRLGITPDLSEFEGYCGTSQESRAIFLYHRVIDAVRYTNIDEFWRNDGKSRVHCDVRLLEMLVEAEKEAGEYCVIVRKIRQLRALLAGSQNCSFTAEMIATSLSVSIDKIIDRTRARTRGCNIKLKFPLLAVAYLNIPWLEPCLLLALFHPTSSPIVVRIKTEAHFESVLNRLDYIQECSTQIDPTMNKEEWWRQKHALDDGVKEVLEYLEDEVLGVWKGLLTPVICNPRQDSLASAMIAGIGATPRNNQSAFRQQLESVLGVSMKWKGKIVDKFPVGLLLGKNIHGIPWECLPCVDKYDISITRVPSFELFLERSQSELPVKIDPRSTFYVLNPSGDLAFTEKTFEPVFKKLRWEGLIRENVESAAFERIIGERDLFVYCGHGAGKESYDYDALGENGKRCRASLLLMGCGSVEVEDGGEQDPVGVGVYCIAAGSGSVVGNLWNVTDRDLDRFFLSFLNCLLKDGPTRLEDALKTARKSCRLRYLTGSAPVVYGFPTLVNRFL
jgi:separase